MTGLGLVATGKRNIKSGDQYERFFDRSQSTGKERLLRTGDTFDTIIEIKALVADTLHQTAKIAPELKGSTRLDTCRNLWDFVYNHFQYSLDAASKEQLRAPLRSWVDRRAGIDCDCMSILMSSILTNLSIPHILRKAKYNGKPNFQHIYVIVPKVGTSIKGKGSYYTLDAVVDKFDYEVPTTATHDLMMPITRLDGLHGAIGYAPSLMGLEGIIHGSLECDCFGQEFEGLGEVPGVNYTPELVEAEFLIRTKKHLENTLAAAKDLPGKANELLRKRLVYLLSNWHNEPARTKALEELEAIEAQEEALNGLPGLGGFFSKIGNAVKSVAKKVTTTVKNVGTKIVQSKPMQAVTKGIKNAAKWVGDKAKDVAEFVVRFNPLTILIRNGLLLAMKLNLFRMSERLGYALWTEQTAVAKGLDLAQWKKLKARYDKALKIFTKLQGQKSSFDKNLKEGWEKGVKKHGLLSGLGEPVTAATGTAAASGVIATIVNYIKDVDFGALFKKLKNKPDYRAEDADANNQPVPEGQTALPADLFEAPADWNPNKTYYPAAVPGNAPSQPVNYQKVGNQLVPTGPMEAPAAGNNNMLLIGGAAVLAIGAFVLTRNNK